MMRRDHCFRKIAELRGDAIVVATYTSAFEWLAIDPSPLNFLSVGSMGQASSHALGLAIGLPGHRVIVLDGDGFRSGATYRVVVEAEDGQSALTVLGANGNGIDFVVTDWNMPGMSGIDLLRAVRADASSST